jgi:chromosome segregation ATPase
MRGEKSALCLTCVAGHVKQVKSAIFVRFPTGVLEYTAHKSSTSLSRNALMSLRLAEEVSTQVPADDFQALEDKIYRTIELYKSAQEARATAERDVKRLREQLEEREEEVESLRREAIGLRKEREEIRGRIEKMLSQIDHITEEQAAS